MNLISNSIVKSLLNIGNIKNDIEDILSWVKLIRKNTHVNIKSINFNELQQWNFSKKTKNLEHDSGKFFSIEGLSCYNSFNGLRWTQPIINQPEIGYLGILCKDFDGTLHFLLQAKIEPGNKNFVQLSPTLQATKSNFTRVHGGKKPDYLDFFTNSSNQEILVDCLQTEQGSRFYKKRNRNIIIKTEKEIKVKENFKWLTLHQIKSLLKTNNLINMDTRTVISCLNIAQFSKNANQKYLEYGNEFYRSVYEDNQTSIQKNLNKLINIKFSSENISNLISVNKIKNWVVSSDRIFHEQEKYFEVVAKKVEIESREVFSWDQPMIKPIGQGVCVLFIKKIEKRFFILTQIKIEPGIFDMLEYGPTIQTNNIMNYQDDCMINYYLNSKASFKTVHDSIQSEEGGRFYLEENINTIVLLENNNDLVEIPENYCWISLSDALFINSINSLFNIQLRSLISLIDYKNN